MKTVKSLLPKISLLFVFVQLLCALSTFAKTSKETKNFLSSLSNLRMNCIPREYNNIPQGKTFYRVSLSSLHNGPVQVYLFEKKHGQGEKNITEYDFADPKIAHVSHVDNIVSLGNPRDWRFTTLNLNSSNISIRLIADSILYGSQAGDGEDSFRWFGKLRIEQNSDDNNALDLPPTRVTNEFDVICLDEI